MPERTSERKPSRRLALAGLGAAAVGGAAVVAGRRKDLGGPHDAYFAGLSRALDRAGIAEPVMVVDRARLAKNIAAVKTNLDGSRLGVRVVVKSLPSMPLIETVADGVGTNRFMVFNGEMLGEMRRRRPNASLLLGKPLPVAAAHGHLKAFGPGAEPQWLIDTPERLAQYAALARANGAPMTINLEVDVGLHRGGFPDAKAVAEAVELARREPLLKVAGLMGYDPHVVKTPDPKAAYARAVEAYAAAREALLASLGVAPGSLTLNTAGSPTYVLHAKDTAANEVSIGSGFVKPVDFDLPTLANHVPAAFIATPVLKALDRFEIPSIEGASDLISFFDPNAERAFFIHGGHWLAKPVSPPGLEFNALYGRSSNQDLLTGSRKVRLKPDDWVFFRPTQSEAIFLEFGDLAVYEGGEISQRWPTFPVSA
jgi:D-serine deaminase-like pyridoxal phosphate-dependent protein